MAEGGTPAAASLAQAPPTSAAAPAAAASSTDNGGNSSSSGGARSTSHGPSRTPSRAPAAIVAGLSVRSLLDDYTPSAEAPPEPLENGSMKLVDSVTNWRTRQSPEQIAAEAARLKADDARLKSAEARPKVPSDWQVASETRRNEVIRFVPGEGMKIFEESRYVGEGNNGGDTRMSNAMALGYVVVEEDGTKAHSSEINKSKREATKRWTPGDIRKFFRALQQVGCDFELMEHFFEGQRKRKELKAMYLKMINDRPNIVKKAILCSSNVNKELIEAGIEKALNWENGKPQKNGTALAGAAPVPTAATAAAAAAAVAAAAVAAAAAAAAGSSTGSQGSVQSGGAASESNAGEEKSSQDDMEVASDSAAAGAAADDAANDGNVGSASNDASAAIRGDSSGGGGGGSSSGSGASLQRPVALPRPTVPKAAGAALAPGSNEGSAGIAAAEEREQNDGDAAGLASGENAAEQTAAAAAPADDVNGDSDSDLDYPGVESAPAAALAAVVAAAARLDELPVVSSSGANTTHADGNLGDVDAGETNVESIASDTAEGARSANEAASDQGSSGPPRDARVETGSNSTRSTLAAAATDTANRGLSGASVPKAKRGRAAGAGVAEHPLEHDERANESVNHATAAENSAEAPSSRGSRVSATRTRQPASIPAPPVAAAAAAAAAGAAGPVRSSRSGKRARTDAEVQEPLVVSGAAHSSGTMGAGSGGGGGGRAKRRNGGVRSVTAPSGGGEGDDSSDPRSSEASVAAAAMLGLRTTPMVL